MIDGDRISPSQAEAIQLGTAARAGERVQITAVRFVRGGILFEINRGSVQHQKWSDHVHVGIGLPESPPSQEAPDATAKAAGAFVLLKLEDGAVVTPDRVRSLLAPVLDFQSLSQAEAYQKSLSPVLAAALKDHRGLVGMDRDMVLSTMGRPQRRLRESSDGQDFEEWIYGSPPEEVQFIRFLRGKVVRIEQMKVTGEKLVRTYDEVGDEVGKLDGVLDASAPKPGARAIAPPAGSPGAMAAPADVTQNAPSTEVRRKKPPTLLRPGEGAGVPDGPDHQRDPVPLPASVPQFDSPDR